ncbi:adenylate cyclase, partial [Rhizobium ruizarguesonis]
AMLFNRCSPTAAGKTLKTRRRLPRRRLVAGIAAAVVLAFAGAALWWQPWMAAKPPGPGERFAYPLPDRPSVAVLPFINVSGDTEHDHLTE